MSPKGEASEKFIPHKAWGEDSDEQAKLEPDKWNLSERTRRGLRTGKGFLGKDIRGDIMDKKVSEAFREKEDKEDYQNSTIDVQRQEDNSPYELHELQMVFDDLPQTTWQKIITELEAQKDIEEKYNIVKAWVAKLKAEGEFDRIYEERYPDEKKSDEYEEALGQENQSNSMAAEPDDVHEPVESKTSVHVSRKLNKLGQLRKGRNHRGLSSDSHGKRGRKKSNPKAGQSFRGLLMKAIYEKGMDRI